MPYQILIFLIESNPRFTALPVPSVTQQRSVTREDLVTQKRLRLFALCWQKLSVSSTNYLGGLPGVPRISPRHASFLRFDPIGRRQSLHPLSPILGRKDGYIY